MNLRLAPRSLLLALTLLPMLALAQATTADLQGQMTPEEFRAAGLDKLTPAELAALNAWLQRKVGDETAATAERIREQAREEGRKEVVEKNRGFFHFGSSEPIVDRIAGEFAGFAKGRQYLLENGQLWQQTDTAQLAGVRRSHPKVTLKPGLMGVWFMTIEGYNTAAKVQRIK
ncbi:hypothetical protein [Pseudoxanthomonas mexicana]|uniref:hypothetical protein n=1 Tax=Pseudoxanthomonas mexicana TaxID=128785 RepID=UPI00398B63D4